MSKVRLLFHTLAAARYQLPPNHSVKRTPKSGLRPLSVAAYLKR